MYNTLPVAIGKILDLTDATLVNGTKVYGTPIAGALRQLTVQIDPTWPGTAPTVTIGIVAKFPGGAGYVPVLSIRQGTNAEAATHAFADGDVADSLVTDNLKQAESWKVYATSGGVPVAGTAIVGHATGDAL